MTRSLARIDGRPKPSSPLDLLRGHEAEVFSKSASHKLNAKWQSIDKVGRHCDRGKAEHRNSEHRMLCCDQTAYNSIATLVEVDGEGALA